ncbi:MAG: DUF3568 family protein [Planctomycetota bacterium]
MVCIRSGVLALLAAWLLVAGAGCSSLTTVYQGEDPTTGVRFRLGELQADVQAQPPQVAEAARKAFEDLDIRESRAQSTAVDAEVVGLTATDTLVRVRAKRLLDGGSIVRIRAGSFGDEEISRHVFQALQEHLGTSRPASPGTLMMPIPPTGGGASQREEAP